MYIIETGSGYSFSVKCRFNNVAPVTLKKEGVIPVLTLTHSGSVLALNKWPLLFCRFASDPLSFSKNHMKFIHEFFKFSGMKFRIIHLFTGIYDSFEVIHYINETVKIKI